MADVLKTLEALIASKTSGVDLAQVAERLIELFGGPVGLANQLYEEWNSAPPNSLARQNYMKAISSLVTHVANEKKQADPISEMSLEELVGAMKGIVHSYGVDAGHEGTATPA